MAIAIHSKKRTHVNKNKKKAWNKYCSVADIEEYFEEKRFEERIGGPASEKLDADLFYVQTTKSKPEKILEKPFNCFKNIGAYTQVKPPITPNVKSFNKKIQNRLASQEKKIKWGAKKVVKSQRTTNFYDLWENNDSKKPESEIANLIEYRDRYTKKKPVKVPVHLYQKPSLLPAVEIPHEGASYNPSEEAHQDLLREALKVEESKKSEEIRLRRALNDMYPTREEAPTKESILAEMSQGLFEKAEEEEEAGPVCLSTNPPVTSESRKRRSVRNKQKRHKLREMQRVAKKEEQRREKEVERIRAIQKELTKGKKASLERQKKRSQLKMSRMFGPRKIGPHKFQPQALAIKLSHELGDSFRELQSEGNLFEDRYKSLQKRNIIEPRVLQKKSRRYKLVVKEKQAFREFE